MSIGEYFAYQIIVLVGLLWAFVFVYMLYQKLHIKGKHISWVRGKNRVWRAYLSDREESGLAIVGDGKNGSGKAGYHSGPETTELFEWGGLGPIPGERLTGSFHLAHKSPQGLNLNALKVKVPEGEKQPSILEAINIDELAEYQIDPKFKPTPIEISILVEEAVARGISRKWERRFEKQQKENVFSFTNILLFVGLAMQGYLIYNLMNMNNLMANVMPALAMIAKQVGVNLDLLPK